MDVSLGSRRETHSPRPSRPMSPCRRMMRPSRGSFSRSKQPSAALCSRLQVVWARPRSCARLLGALLDPRRRFVSVSCPRDGTLLFTLVAERLGQRVGREPSRLGAWRALERAIRVASLQGEQVVVIVEDCDDQLDATDAPRSGFARPAWVDRRAAGLTIIQARTHRRRCRAGRSARRGRRGSVCSG